MLQQSVKAVIKAGLITVQTEELCSIFYITLNGTWNLTFSSPALSEKAVALHDNLSFKPSERFQSAVLTPLAVQKQLIDFCLVAGRE